jgi:hypothetical protein
MATHHESESQDASRDDAFADSKADRDATLAALRRLEAASGMAASGREAEWLQQMQADLQVVRQALTTEREESLRPDSLLSMIARDYPRRFGSRIRQLRAQHDDIERSLSALAAECERMWEDRVDVGTLRQGLAESVDVIRRRWERETDLVYEALRLDLGLAEHERAAE